MTNEIVNAVTEIFEKRKSIRAFSEEPVNEADINAIIESAASAPSAMNEQPWRFLLAFKKDKDTYSKVLNALSEGNRIWAEKAPLLIVTYAKKTDRNNTPNKYYMYDTGQAMGFLLVKAVSLGLSAHEMGGFSAVTLNENFNFGEDFEPVVITAIGYKGDASKLPDNFYQREITPRIRKEISEIILNTEKA